MEDRVKVTVHLARTLWKRAKLQAVEEERGLRELVSEAIERYLDTPKKKGAKHGAR